MLSTASRAAGRSALSPTLLSGLRWYVKKTARLGVALGSGITGASVLDRWLHGSAVRVLTYHRFGSAARDPFCVAPAIFEEQVRMLAERRLAVSLEQVQAFVAGHQTLPDGSCLVTIDDGLVSTLTEALPVLARHRVPAVAFVSTAVIGRRSEAQAERYLAWDELQQIADSGVITVGSHAHTHRSLGLLGPEEVQQEARRSREILEQKLGRKVASFAYPFGTGSDFNAVTERALREAGYEIAFNSVHGAIRAGMCPVSLPRVKVEGGDPRFVFAAACRGGMDAWSFVDRNLWHLQGTRPAAT
jgi:peptidoglycan/xylan/chitin deacetylase (PgdA/CDA1 family)